MNPAINKSIKDFEYKQSVVAALGLVILCGLSTIFNHIYLAGQAEQTAKFISRMVHLREFREVATILQEARLKHFNIVKYESPNDGLSFTLPEIANLFPNKSIWHELSTEQIVVSAAASSGSLGSAKMTFEINRFSFVGHAFLIWLALVVVSIPQTRIMRRRIVAQIEKDLEVEKQTLKADLARKVRHNIRTPLAALIRLSDTAQGLRRQEVNLFQSIIAQIRFLVSELDDEKPYIGSIEKVPIYDCVRDSFRELNLAMPQNVELSLQLDDSVISARVQFVYHELRSLISNLCSNSREAIATTGKISIVVSDYGNEIVISVEDTGRGVEPQLLKKVTEKGFSTRKRGTGLGLYLAEDSVRSWGGSLKIESTVGVGTVVRLHLPVLERESWYVPRVKIRNGDTVIVVDDQVSVHRMWDMRLDESGFVGNRYFYFSGEDACGGVNGQDSSGDRTHVFLDQDLGKDRLTGLSVFETHFTTFHRYLVTGNFDDIDIRNACDSRKIALIPKTELSSLPIVVQ